MRISESIINNLFIEVDSLNQRLKNIKESLKTISNSRLRERLIEENHRIYERVKNIYNVAEFLNKGSKDNINFPALLLEKAKRTLIENRTMGRLFFL